MNFISKLRLQPTEGEGGRGGGHGARLHRLLPPQVIVGVRKRSLSTRDYLKHRIYWVGSEITANLYCY